MKGVFILIFCVGFFTIHTCAQSKELMVMAPLVLSGKWEGKVTQKKGGLARSYVYEIEIELKGSQISGKGIIKTDAMYGYFNIQGELKGNDVLLKDVKITNEKIREQAAWCIKNMPLKFLFKNGQYCLEGPWSGYSKFGDCTPGYIYLKKAAIRV